MFKLTRAAMITLTGALGLALGIMGITGFPTNLAYAAANRLSDDDAYTFAGVVVDRSRRVKTDKTSSEIRVTIDMPRGKNSGKAYDVIFLIRPSTISAGKILALTSSPANQCRPFLKTFLTKSLSPARIKKAYDKTRLATTDSDIQAKSLADGLKKNGWLKSCSAEAKGEVDVFQILIINDQDS